MPSRSVCLLTLLSLAFSCSSGWARAVLQLGGQGGRAWQSSGTLTSIDVDRTPGSMWPFSTTLTQNLALQLRDRGGDISTTAQTEGVPSDWSTDRYLIVDGDSTTAFVHEPQINKYGGAGTYYTVDMRFDLGVPFPVERIRFLARPQAPGNLLRQFRLWVNDGSSASQNAFGDPLWTLLRDEKDNLQPLVDLDIEPQVIRHIRLRPWETNVTWEVAELEVFGQGFTPEASFVSDPIDLEAATNFGQIWWAGHRDPEAKVLIQTRTGSDDQPLVYWRKTGIGDQEVPYGENGKPLTAASYRFLAPDKKGRITDDTDNWSVWQTYEFDAGLVGTPLLSPSPRRYLQVRVAFSSHEHDGASLDSLWFDYSQPPVATQLIGEIDPSLVAPSEPVRFTYAVRARLEAGQSGFDALEVRAPVQIDSVLGVTVDREPVSFSSEALDGEPPGFRVRFPRVTQDQTLVQVVFEARVFRYGTLFGGAVRDMRLDEVPQTVTPGDAVDDMLADGLRVRTTLGGRLIGEISAEPPVCTPNGDGINDRFVIQYAVLRLTEAAPVTAEILDLAGRRVRLLADRAASSGHFEAPWDGTDDAGRAVAPGLYLYRLEVRGASGSDVRIGQVAVVY